MAYFEPHLSMLLTNAGHREPYAMHVNLVEGDETIIDVFGLTDPQMPGLDEKFGRTTVKGGTSNSANDFEVYNETLNGCVREWENPKQIYCTEESRMGDFCIEVYQPVCSNLNKTYSNSCFACLDSSVKYYIEGEC